MKGIVCGLVMLSLLAAGRALAEDAAPDAAPQVAGAVAVQTYVATPLADVLQRYATASGCRVERVAGVKASVNMPTAGTDDVAGLRAAIDAALAPHNIALFTIGEKHLVATWIDPARAPTNTIRRLSLTELLELEKAGIAPPAAD